MFRKKQPAQPWVAAIVAAAGKASRMQGLDKQRACIDGIPVVVHAIQAISRCELIREVILVCPVGQIPEYYQLVRDFDLELVSQVIGGEQTRQQSVFAGVRAADEKAQYFAIHDGARPLVSPEEVRDCIQAAFTHGAAALGVQPKDTIKQVDEQGFITGTTPRAGAALIHTPQVFEAQLYRQAMSACQGQDYTDDCQLIEQAGQKVYLVPGRYENIKITTPNELALARALLHSPEIDDWEVDE